MFEKIKSFLFKNTTAKQTVAKNTVWLSVSNFGGRLIKAGVVIYAARVLGASEWGVFSYATTLAAFFTLFVDPGLNAIVMRDAGKSNEKDRFALFSTAFIIKLFLIAIAVLFIIFIGPSFSTLPGATMLLPIAALIIVFDVLRECFSALIRSMEKMEWEAGIYILTNIAIVIFGFMFLLVSPTAHSFGWGYVIGTAAGTIIAAIALRRYLKKMFSHFSAKLIKPIFKAAWPFAATSALGFLLTSTDVLIISWILTATDVGVYSAAVRIVQMFYLVPMIFQYSALPLFSRLARKDDPKFRIAFEQILGIVFLMSIPLAIGGAILGTQVMQLVFGSSYGAGGLSLKILMLTMLVDFPSMILSGAIFAYGQQKSLVISSIIGGITNVVLDLVLIPRFGIAGSAVATIIAQTASNWYIWHAMKSINYFAVLPKLYRAATAGLAMGMVVLVLFFAHINVILNILIGAGAYGILLVLMREPLLFELKNIISPKKTD